ncbi:rCG54132, partial [Rattus norvegicus]
MTAILTRQ